MRRHYSHLTKVFKYGLQHKLMRLILLDRFNLNMFKEYPIGVVIDKLSVNEFCLGVENAQDEGYLINTITDESLLKEISKLCGFELKKGEKKRVKLFLYDKVYIIKKRDKKLIFYEILI